MDIGFWELCVIALVALIVFGPERLPDVAQKIGRFITTCRGMWQNVSKDFQDKASEKQHDK